MPKRQTKRGEERTPLSGNYDVIVCGASFAGLTVARQLAGADARVLVLDRYEIGERQTSACGIPTAWLDAMGLEGSKRQEVGEPGLDTPRGTSRYELPWTFSTFDYRELCQLLWAQCDADFETAKVNGRTGETVHTDRGDVSAPLIVDAQGWRRILPSDRRFPPPPAPRLGRRLPAARRAALPRARGAPRGRFRRPRDLDRPALRPCRLRLELSRS